MKKYIVFILAVIIPQLLFITGSYSYPNQEKAQLSFTGVSSQAVQMYLTSDQRYLYLGYSNKVKVVDMGTFELRGSAYQPYDFGSDSEFSGIVGGLALSSSRLYVTKDDGKMLYFDLNDLTKKPVSVTIASGKELGKVFINSGGSALYILNKDDNKVIHYAISGGTVTEIPLTSSVSVTATDMELFQSVSSGSDYVYVTSDQGHIYKIVDGSMTATEVLVANAGDNLFCISMNPNKTYLYTINATDKSVVVVNPVSLSFVKTIDMEVDTSEEMFNESFEGLVSVSVTHPVDKYTFAAGILGISVINGTNELIDADSGGSYDYNPIAIEGDSRGPMMASTDAYIYMSIEGGKLSVITEKPYVTVSDVTYSGGGSSMSTGESVTITFQSDEDGTFKTLIGGTITADGTAISSSGGTGSVTAGTDNTVTINYDDDSAHLSEGANEVFIFVTSSGGYMGRDAASITVDTPPPAVTVTGTGFGNGRIYVNMERLTVSDMSHYNVYVDTDADKVANREVTPSRVSQPESGSTVVGEISGLSNGTMYYVGVEAVDEGGNVGPYTITFSDGSRITGTPELTVGPAQMMGEKGCSFISAQVSKCGSVEVFRAAMIFGLLMFVLILCRLSFLRKQESKSSISKKFIIVLFLLLLLGPKVSFAGDDEEKSPKWWSTEVKVGFWMPQNSTMKQFFEPCCNIMPMVVQGFLYDSKYGAELGAGIMSKNGTAIGSASGSASQDRFNLFLVPMETNFAFRADFFTDQIIVPYVKAGFDYVYFRQNLKGTKVSGVKTGMHAVGGIQILLDMLDSNTRYTMEEDYGINDFYLILEGRYNWINSFGSGGLDLSSIVCSFGLLFEY